MHFFQMLLIFLLVAASSCSSASALAKTHDKLQQTDSLPEIARQTLALHFGESNQDKDIEKFSKSLAVPKQYKKPAGLFVTLSRNGKTRACWGSINAQYPNLVVGTVYTTEAAISKEYRYKKVKANEWQYLKPQVTVIRSVEALNSMGEQNPMLYGLMVRTGTKAAVILPGEATDAHYQLMMCKVKAGIASNQPCQIYRIKADVFK